ncbi:MAG TPA: BrnT family toxin [Methyloceanibacter sp.]
MTAVPTFEWDEAKNRLNQEKHGVAFELAQFAFFDERRVIAEDLGHSNRSSVIIASAGSEME